MVGEYVVNLYNDNDNSNANFEHNTNSSTLYDPFHLSVDAWLLLLLDLNLICAFDTI